MRDLLARDERALSDVADVLRDASSALGANLSPIGKLVLRVQTWRLDIGTPADPNKPRPAGQRPAHLPLDERPPRR
jgi:hypothetical protein